jgi:hypothetical protein
MSRELRTLGMFAFNFDLGVLLRMILTYPLMSLYCGQCWKFYYYYIPL